jgi:hypothetical protein
MGVTDHDPAQRAVQRAAGAALVSSALAHRAGRRSASTSYCSNTTCAVKQQRRPCQRSPRSCWDGRCRKKSVQPLVWRWVMRCSAPSRQAGKIRWQRRACQPVGGRMDSTVPSANGWWQKSAWISCVSRCEATLRLHSIGRVCPLATLSLPWASQKAPSLQPDLPLAWHASGGLGGAGGDLMSRCHVGEAFP